MLKKIITIFAFICLFTSSVFNPVSGKALDKVPEEENFVLAIPLSRIGDLNGDDNVNSLDAALLKRYILEAISKLPLEDELWVADLNGDNKINSMDYALMVQYILHYIDQFPKEVRNDYIQVECGISHTVALKYDGTVWVWGDNSNRKLGIEEGGSITKPFNIKELQDIVYISTGDEHSLALKKDGTLWAWGRNVDNQLGDGTNTTRRTPIKVEQLEKMIDIAAGGNFSVALKDDGTVWTWGNNKSGQLGDGTTSKKAFPVMVEGLSGIKKIAAGYDHVLALKEDGTVWAWGSGTFGQLGNGSEDLTSVPVKVNNLAGVKDISAGKYVSAALKDDGTVWFWGNNETEMMGHNSKDFYYDIPKKYEYIEDVKQVDISQFYIAVLKNDGTVWAWGSNDKGVLGDESTEKLDKPVKMEGLSSIRALSAGENHMAVIKSDGSLWSWGDNKYGQMGNGTGNFVNVPVNIPDVSKITKVVTGLRHVVALDEDGNLWGWGDSSSLQLIDSIDSNIVDFPHKIERESLVADIIAGPGRTGVIRQDGTVMLYATTSFSDSLIKPLEIEFFKDYEKVGIGDKHIVGIAGNQKVYSSGDSYWGQLGNGSQNHHNNFGDNFTASVEVSDLEGIIDISTGKDHTIALKEDGTVWGWGVNLNGELGNGLTSHISLVPTQVLEVEDIIAISSGMNHVLALKKDGTVWAWGRNSSGQVGNGATSSSVRTPVQVKGLDNVVGIMAGKSHSMAIKADGSVWVWGDNTFGQLGDGTNENKLLPVENEKLKGAKLISGKGDFTIVLKEDGRLLSMGDNSFSTLGIGRTDIVTQPVKAH
ncbi:MAG: hypothetical protein GX387_06545 [Clostridium sp.]|jgi:alpha-tubulin suppressor-like RCC1 family protein|nr:hypothetical protein [Clostridium sp.]